MAKNNIMANHFRETAELKSRQKKEWGQLLRAQEDSLTKESNVAGMAERFSKERDDHNNKFAKEKAELLQKQQKELVELKKLKQLEKSNDEMER